VGTCVNVFVRVRTLCFVLICSSDVCVCVCVCVCVYTDYKPQKYFLDRNI